MSDDSQYPILDCSKHDGRKLNYGCIGKPCINRLLCDECTLEHTKHIKHIRTFKFMLDKRNSFASIEKRRQEIVKDYESMYQNRMNDVLKQVDSLAEHLKTLLDALKEKVKKDFDDEKVRMTKFFDEFLDLRLKTYAPTAGPDIKSQESLSKYFEDEADRQGAILEKNEAICEGMYEELCSEFINCTTNQKYEAFEEKAKKEIERIMREFPYDMISPSEFRINFSEKLKSLDIDLSKDLMTATVFAGERVYNYNIVVCEADIGRAKTKVSWKVKLKRGESKSTWIAVGAGLEQYICKSKRMVARELTQGNGLYLLSTNGYSWSHVRDPRNHGASVMDETVCELTYDPDLRLLSIVAGRIKVDLEVVIEGKLFPCCVMLSNGDAVSLVFDQKASKKKAKSAEQLIS